MPDGAADETAGETGADADAGAGAEAGEDVVARASGVAVTGLTVTSGLPHPAATTSETARHASRVACRTVT
jgi:hypothetical protein